MIFMSIGEKRIQPFSLLLAEIENKLFESFLFLLLHCDADWKRDSFLIFSMISMTQANKVSFLCSGNRHVPRIINSVFKPIYQIQSWNGCYIWQKCFLSINHPTIFIGQKAERTNNSFWWQKVFLFYTSYIIYIFTFLSYITNIISLIKYT